MRTSHRTRGIDRPRKLPLRRMVAAVDGPVDWAAAEAAGHDVALRIVSGYWEAVVFDPYSPPLSPDLGTLGLADDAVLAAQAQVVRRRPALQTSTALHRGGTAVALLEESRPDTLLVITRRRGISARWTLRRVLHQASGPVAVIPRDDAASHNPAGRVLVVDDGTRASSVALDAAFEVARRREVGVTLLRLRSMPSEHDIDGWRERVAQGGLRFELVADDPGALVTGLAREASLVVLPVRRRPLRVLPRWLTPWILRVVQSAETPVLLVPSS